MVKIFQLPYQDGINSYKLRFPKKRGPSIITKVTDENFKDITTEMRELMGPCHNFHSIPTTPQLLGYKKLYFYYRDGKMKEFENLEPIVL